MTPQLMRLGEWHASAHWATTPAPPPQDLVRGSDAPDESIENVELLQILGAIADDVARHCAALCAGIMADFAARTAHARRSLPRSQAAAAAMNLSQQRQAALQLARQMARLEIKARQDAARILYQRPRRPSIRRGRDRDDPSPRR